MNRRGVALLVVLLVIVLAGAVLVAVMAAVNLEIGATRAAVMAVQGEAALLDLREDVLADSPPLGAGSGAVVPTAWRSGATETVLGAVWIGAGPDSLAWLYLSTSAPAVRNMMMVTGISADTNGVGHFRPLDRRTNIYPYF